MRYFALTIILVLTTMFLSGCGQPDNTNSLEQNKLENIFSDTNDVPEDDYLEEYEIDYGTVKQDGEDYILEFEKEEVDDGLFLEKSVEFTKDGDGYIGSITLEFEGEGEYIETIPKSFAASVDDLEFSVEPDEIIEDDPIVKWEITKTEQTVQQIKINAMTQAGVAATGEMQDAFWQGRNPLSAAANTGQSVAVGSVIDDMAFIRGLNKCNSIKHAEPLGEAILRQRCELQLLRDWPERFTEKDCKDIHFVSDAALKACMAITKRTSSECFDDSDLIESSCRELVFNIVSNRCADNNQDCLYNAAIWSGWPDACNKLKSNDKKNSCLAQTYDNMVYCKEISDESERRACCKELTYDDDDLADCLDSEEETPLEVIPEEQEDQDEFRTGSGCPVSPPAEAKMVEAWSGSFQMLRYSMPDYRNVGPYYKWYDKEKTQSMSVECWNLNSKREGPQVFYDKDGFKTQEYTLDENGDFTGTRKVWRNQQLTEESNWKDGKRHGTWKTWQDNGILLSIQQHNMGVANGEFKTYSSVSGNLREENTYADGKATDTKKYRDDGEVYYERHGSYDSNGKFTGWALQNGYICDLNGQAFENCVAA